MKWHEKFKVGQEVRVARKVIRWKFDGGRGGADWVMEMNQTINRTYKIKQIDVLIGYQLDTGSEFNFYYWYPCEALEAVVGTQLLFNFMNEE